MASRGCPFLFLTRLILNMMVSVTSSGIQSIARVRFDPPYIHDLMAGANKTVKITVDVDTNRQEFAKMPPEKPFTIVLKSIDEGIATAAKNQKQFTLGEYSSKKNDCETYEVNVTLTGHFLGKTAVKVRLQGANDTWLDDDKFLYEIDRKGSVFDQTSMLDVWVIQDNNRLENRFFLSALVLLIVIANVLLGCELDGHVVLKTIRTPIAPLIGFCTQFIAMPLLAYGIAKVIFTANGLHSFALGLFVTGCVPGGGASNYWTLLLDGNVPVSITMTFCSTLASLIMIPLWMWLLGSTFLRSFHPEAVIKIPYIKIISSLITIVVPLVFGLTISHFKPALRFHARKVMRPFVIFVLAFLICFGGLANMYMVRLLTWTAVAGSLLLPWCGFAVGCLTAVILRQPPANVTSIAIETGIQNTGIAIMLLKFSFPDPDADISALIPIICATMMTIPLLSIVGIHWILKKLMKGEENNVEKTVKVNSITHNSSDKYLAVVHKCNPNDDSPLMNNDTKPNI